MGLLCAIIYIHISLTGMFIGLGLSGVIPALHYVITDGFYHAINKASLGWLVLMAFLYIAGAVIYAVRIPERLFPGKFDIWVSKIISIEALVCRFASFKMLCDYFRI